VNTSARELETRLDGVHRLFQLTDATALSREVETLPPSDVETIKGRPEARAELRTKFKPDTLRKGNGR
jgi:hypothetical protein